jgi:hypothetical protein
LRFNKTNIANELYMPLWLRNAKKEPVTELLDIE